MGGPFTNNEYTFKFYYSNEIGEGAAAIMTFSNINEQYFDDAQTVIKDNIFYSRMIIYEYSNILDISFNDAFGVPSI